VDVLLKHLLQTHSVLAADAVAAFFVGSLLVIFVASWEWRMIIRDRTGFELDVRYHVVQV